MSKIMDLRMKLKNRCGVCSRSWKWHQLPLPVCYFSVERIVRRCYQLRRVYSEQVTQCHLVREFPCADPGFLKAVVRGTSVDYSTMWFDSRMSETSSVNVGAVKFDGKMESQSMQLRDGAVDEVKIGDEIRMERVLEYVQDAQRVNARD